MIPGDRGAFDDLRLCFDQTQKIRDALFLVIFERDMDIGDGIQANGLSWYLRAITRDHSACFKIAYSSPALRGRQPGSICQFLHRQTSTDLKLSENIYISRMKHLFHLLSPTGLIVSF